MTRGADGVSTPTSLDALLTPSDFAEVCQAIVETQGGNIAHRALDALVTELLTSLGYGEGMAIFVEAVRDKHPTSTDGANGR